MPQFNHIETLSFPQALLYKIITDVSSYPEFLPWCLSAHILEKSETTLLADLTVGIGLFKETFRSHVILTPLSRVEVIYKKGALKHLKTHWILNEVSPSETEITFHVDFAFHSQIFNKMMESLFEHATHKMIIAFKKRAELLMKSHV